ncbi:TetR/AcrR family transcriptional regulator [Pseudonocardia acaciae]|uniref:TetR/AcrR family transcriptional regulator n=1 Tax=Pseudonocardia acaciae TaxID=551276 RepID=UPI00048F0EC9|nr:TetR/AcrR family transcriptional regulator [Pseudonocardia acaciae]
MERALSTAEERRPAVLAAAVRAFAVSGYRGTPVARVATEAGISPAYVFRLFPTKQGLFIAAVHACFDRILDALATRADALPSTAPAPEVLSSMADAYAALIADRTLLALQVHALAAADEPEIQRALRAEHARLVRYVADRSRAPLPAVQNFFARGQLCHLVTVLGIESVDEEWAGYLNEGIRHYPAEARDNDGNDRGGHDDR